MDQLIAAILPIIQDYHQYNGFQFTREHILNWVNQFEEGDRVFILEELLHLLGKGIYISETRAREMLLRRIDFLAAKNGYHSTPAWLADVELLRMQKADKSQDILLGILHEELLKKYGTGLEQCGSHAHRFALYIDDVLATGNTVFTDTSAWLRTTLADGERNLDKIVKNEKTLIVSLFCLHSGANVRWRLKVALSNDDLLKKIQLHYNYEVQNNPTFHDQKLNFAYPTGQQPQSVYDYLKGLTGSSHENKAFRKDGSPTQEGFFSSPAHRIRFENILLHTGIQLLAKAATLKPNHRPLGATFPSYKTLGTGTLFFTWRNISNTCPIVFWWDTGGWRPLFPLFRRGLGGTTFAPYLAL